MKIHATPNFVQGEEGNCSVILSQRNLEMLLQYGAIHKHVYGNGSMDVSVEPDELHYTPEQEQVHKDYTDPRLVARKDSE